MCSSDLQITTPEMDAKDGVLIHASSSVQDTVIETHILAAPVFDYAAMSSRLMNDETLMRTVTEAFLEDMAQQIEQLKLVAAASDAQQVALLVHKIKGASANVGGMVLSDLASQMERQADDPEIARKDLLELEQGFVLLKAAMTEALL